MITEIELSPISLRQQGLTAPVTLRSLGRLVVLAGPNGSGKSRYLRAVQDHVARANEWVRNSGWETSFPQWEQHLVTLRKDSAANSASIAPLEDLLDKRAALHALAIDGVAPLESAITLVDLTYQVGTGIDRADANPEERIAASIDETKAPGFASAFRNQHKYLTVIARYLFNADRYDFEKNEQLKAQKKHADAFNDIVKALLGVEVLATTSNAGAAIPLVMGRPFAEQELSTGQRILMAWAIILHQQREQLENAIVLVDEPENHLHPHVCIEALTNLQARVLGARGQIWLATHSVPLIAWAGLPAIHAVSSGKVAYAGNRVDEVVDGLTGGPDGRERLREFLSDADKLGFFQFASECLTRPSVAHSHTGDPQETCFARLVAERSKNGAPLRLLDFGAGRGRMAAALLGSKGANLTYLAYEPTDLGGELDERIRQLNGVGHTKAARVTDLRSIEDAERKMDVIVLCNVLHELSIGDWLATFKTVASVLRNDGCMVLIEDQTPSVGELPQREGFAILDELETRRLFGGDDAVVALTHTVPEAWRSRISAIEVPHAALLKASATTIGRALSALRTRAESRIKELRAEGRGLRTAYQSGRLHALYSMLWVNAELALRAYPEP